MNVFGFDVADIGQTISVTRNAGGLLKETLGSLQKASDMLRGPKELGAKDGVQIAFIDALNKLIQFQTAHSEILDRLQRTEADLKAAQARHDESRRYQLTQLPMGGFVLALKPEEANGEPLHYICQTCNEAGKKSILQPRGNSQTIVECPTCDHRIRLRGDDNGDGMITIGEYNPFL